MGCCSKKTKDLKNIDSLMKMDNFFIKKINFAFVRKKIDEYNNCPYKNYYAFWTLVKHCGIHQDISYQRNYWELAYAKYSDESILGILMILILQCNGNEKDKISYITQYIQKDIIKSKIQDEHLIMNLEMFKTILKVYFCCMTKITLEAVDKKLCDISQIQLEEVIRKYDEKIIKSFIDKFLTDYVKKNFFVNAGKLLVDKINFLIDENMLRAKIKVHKLNSNEDVEIYDKVENKEKEKPVETKIEKEEEKPVIENKL